MDFQKQLESGYLQVRDLDRMVRDCRTMASKLGFVLSWRIKSRTATAFIKFNRHIVWRAEYTHELPHIVLCLMYHGVYAELNRREQENKESILQMRRLEEERNQERKVMNLPNWGDRRK